jgi:hypothetical protein
VVGKKFKERKTTGLLINCVKFRKNIARSIILGWEGVGNRQLLCFFKA